MKKKENSSKIKESKKNLDCNCNDCHCNSSDELNCNSPDCKDSSKEENNNENNLD